MSDFTDLISDAEELKKNLSMAVYDGITEVGRRMAENARDFSAVDTETLRSSWEIRQDNIINEDEKKQIDVWSNPNIIATNPKHKDGYYYSIDQEEGYTDKNGVWRNGRFMLASSITIAEEELPQVIEEKLSNYMDD